MDNVKISKNEIIYNRFGELVRITPCGKNAIRFEGFPGCKVFEENFTLIPQKADCKITETDYYVSMKVGSLELKLEQRGKLTFYKDDKVIIEENRS